MVKVQYIILLILILIIIMLLSNTNEHWGVVSSKSPPPPPPPPAPLEPNKELSNSKLKWDVGNNINHNLSLFVDSNNPQNRLKVCRTGSQKNIHETLMNRYISGKYYNNGCHAEYGGPVHSGNYDLLVPKDPDNYSIDDLVSWVPYNSQTNAVPANTVLSNGESDSGVCRAKIDNVFHSGKVFRNNNNGLSCNIEHNGETCNIIRPKFDGNIKLAPEQKLENN